MNAGTAGTKGARILITGASGLIGTRLSARLLDRGHEVLPATLDILDRPALDAALASRPWDHVIHLASISHVPTCERDPDLADRVNAEGTSQVIAALRAHAPQARLIFASTAQVYRAPEPSEAPLVIDESREPVPQNTYARTKWKAEQAIRGACASDGLRATILRLFNHSHRSQSPEFLLPHLYQAILRGDARIPVGNLDLVRDIGAVDDATDAFASLIERPSAPAEETLNLCSATGKHLGRLAAELARQLSRSVEYVPDPARFRAGEPHTVIGSHARLTLATGWEPRRAANETRMIESFLTS